MNEPASQSELSRVLDHLAAERQRALDRLFQSLAIPSVSTDPAYHAACVAAAEWCARNLREIGFQARFELTAHKATVVGHWRSASSALRVLFMVITTCGRRILGGMDHLALRAMSHQRPAFR